MEADFKDPELEAAAAEAAAAEGTAQEPKEPSKYQSVDENTWKWAPIILISPLPWALVSIFVMGAGQAVLFSSNKVCVNEIANYTMDLSPLVNGLAIAVGDAYLFLVVYSWAWLGHSVYLPWPTGWKKKFGVPVGFEHWKQLRVLKPFKKLSHIAWCYGVFAAISVVPEGLLAIGFAQNSYICASQTPSLLTLSFIILMMYAVAMGVTLARLWTVLFYDGVKKCCAKKAGVELKEDAGPMVPQSDVDMVRKVFMQFDDSGEGVIDSSELGRLMEALGMPPNQDMIDEALIILDGDSSGTITLEEFETWYVSELNTPSDKTKKKLEKNKKEKDKKKKKKKDEEEDEDDEDDEEEDEEDD